METGKRRIDVEVAYVSTERAFLLPVQAPAGATIREVIHESGILSRCPEIDLDSNRVGIFSRLRELHEMVEDGDRVEIYRPLPADPKEARRRRARRQKAGRDG